MTVLPAPRTPSAPVRFWLRISPHLIPFLAVITAFLFGIPLLMITERSVGGGIVTAGIAYSALIEGITGLTINNVVTPDSFAATTSYASTVEISKEGLTRQARPIERVESMGASNIRTWEALLEQYSDLTDAEIELIGISAAPMRDIGSDRIRATGVLLSELNALGLTRSDVRAITNLIARKTSLNETEKAAVAVFYPAINTLSDDGLRTTLDHLNLVNTYTAGAMTDFATIQARFDGLGIDLYGDATSQLVEIALNNPERVREAFATLKTLDAAGVDSPAELGAELRLLGNLYNNNLLTSDTVNLALQGELKSLLAEMLIVSRPGDNILYGAGLAQTPVGIMKDTQNQPVGYVYMGGSALLFVPAQLEATIVKAIPYIIIGVAVGLGFAAGVFNIGAEGQLHIGAIVTAWVGVALVGLPAIVHIPVVLLAGALGGMVWGGIPGILKAFTGASEVVVTIMMNFIAAFLIDWIINQDPPILRDPNSSVPRTPQIAQSAMLPHFGALPGGLFVIFGVVVFGLLYWQSRDRSARRWWRPLVLGVLTVALGFFMQAINVTDSIHIGFIFMFVVVFGADWFLQRTTAGFELRTVGINQNAARYAGMNVALNVVLAMALSGMLAGFAGAVQISGREFAMVPNLFAGYGFDSISVALLARKNPRNMIWSGLLWGGLLSAGGLMQIRADVPIDLVKIIQALIIMFVAADQIIRFIYRIPDTKDDSKLIFTAK